MADKRNALGVPLSFKGWLWSKLLDAMVGAGAVAQGDVLYRGASVWARLPAGTSGRFLKTQGAGADPLWASVYGGNVGQVFYEAQAADLVVTSNASFQNSDLVISLAAGTYGFEMVNFTTSHATPGLTAEINYTGTVTSSSVQLMRQRATAANSLNVAGSLPFSMPEVTTDSQWRHVVGGLIVSTSGDLRLQIRQTTSNINAVTLRAGSFLRVVEL